MDGSQPKLNDTIKQSDYFDRCNNQTMQEPSDSHRIAWNHLFVFIS
jgi:hypothetical protein